MHTMIVEDLHRVLSAAMAREAPANRSKTEPAFQLLEKLLREYADLSVEEFCLKARDGLKKKAISKKSPKIPVVNEVAVTRYLNELEQTKVDSRQFEKIVGRMKKDKEIRADEAREIARLFVGGSQSYKTKADTFKAILQRQIADLRTAGKAPRIADIF